MLTKPKQIKEETLPLPFLRRQRHRLELEEAPVAWSFLQVSGPAGTGTGAGLPLAAHPRGLGSIPKTPESIKSVAIRKNEGKS